MNRKALYGNRVSKLPVRNSGASRRSRSLSRNTVGLTVPGSVRLSRTRSVSQTPVQLYPGSAIRSRSRSVEKSRIKKKDIRPVADKQWQIKQTAKTQKYIIEIGHRDLLNNGTTLRPLTLKMFVQIMNVLLDPIIDSDDLTTTNYIERLPVILSLLKYPGVYSASVLKTANTTGSWPHILAMISWMTVVHELVTKDFQIQYMEEKSIEEKINDLKHVARMKGYVVFNKQNELREVEEWISGELDKLLDLPDDLEEFIQKNSIECNKIMKDCNELEKNDQNELEQLENYKYEIISNIEYATQARDYKINYINNTDEEMNNMNHDIEKTDDDIKNLEDKLKILETESCDDDNEKYLTEVADLQKQLEMSNEMIKYKRDLDEKFNNKHKNVKAILNAKIQDYNITLIKQSLTHPELENILLPQDISTIDNINEILDETYEKAKELKKKGELEKENHQQKIALLNKQIQKEQLKEDSRNEELERMKKLIRSLEVEIEQFQQYTEKETEICQKDISEKKQKCVELSKNLLSDIDKNERAKELIERLNDAKNDLSKFEDDMVNFFQNLKIYNKQQLNHIDETTRIVDEKITKMAKDLENSINTLKKN